MINTYRTFGRRSRRNRAKSYSHADYVRHFSQSQTRTQEDGPGSEPSLSGGKSDAFNTRRLSGGEHMAKMPRNRVFLLILMLITLGGVLIGTLLYLGLDETGRADLAFMTNGFLSVRQEEERAFLHVLLSSFTAAGGLLLVCFFLGFSAVAQPLEIMIPIFRGMGLGMSIAGIYAVYGAKGFLIAFLLILPGAVVSTMGLLLAVRESLQLSGHFSGFAFWGRTDREMSRAIRFYLLKFLILFVIIGIAALLDSLLTLLFVGIL